MKYRIGLCQFAPRLLEQEKNLARIEELVTGLKADLVVLPELASSGYLFNSGDELFSVSEDSRSGPTARLLLDLAGKNDMSISAGFAERENDRIYNSAMLVNPDGTIHVYRKIHLFFEEKLYFKPGDRSFGVFPAHKGVKVGMMICFDWIFPESSRSLALQGAEIIAHNANLVLPWCQQAMITRSIENRIFSATANRTGTEINGDKKLTFTGMSQVVDPQGNVLNRLDKEEESVAVVEIETDIANDKFVTARNHILEDRRPDLYSGGPK